MCVRSACWAALLLVVSTTAIAERLPVRTYTTRDGLTSNTILHLVEDSHGFLWFATRDGLSRFDGERFVSTEVDLLAPHLQRLLHQAARGNWDSGEEAPEERIELLA